MGYFAERVTKVFMVEVSDVKRGGFLVMYSESTSDGSTNQLESIAMS